MTTPVLAPTICAGCKQPIGSIDHCTDTSYPYVTGGSVQWLEPIPYGDPREGWVINDITPPERCNDCGVKLGATHHWHCDVATCPNCRQQLFGCGCDMRSEDELDAGSRP
jgi:hypothetical protein